MEMQQGFRAGRELGKTGGTEFRTRVTGMRDMEWSTTAGTEVFGAQGNGRYGKQQGCTAREKILNGEGSREERGTLVAGFPSDDCRSWC